MGCGLERPRTIFQPQLAAKYALVSVLRGVKVQPSRALQSASPLRRR